MASSAQTPNNHDGVSEGSNGSSGLNGSHALNSGTSEAQNQSTPPTLTRSSTAPTGPHLPAPSSAANSPKASREGSPTRPSLKSGRTTGNRSTTRSRNNSQDLSPIRGPSGPSIPTVPSAAAIQRALSAAGGPHLPTTAKQDSAGDPAHPQKVNRALTGAPGLKLPRVSSPPPSASSGLNKSLLPTARKPDHSQSTPTTPSIVVDRPIRSSTFASDSDVGEDDRSPKSGMRTPVRGSSGTIPALETVQESSVPSTPVITGARSGQINKTPVHDRPERIEENPIEDALAKEAQSRPESGNESAGNRSIAANSEAGKELKKLPVAANTSKPAAVSSKRSFTQLPFTKASKAGAEGSVKNMTVETETVSSIPQVAIGGGAGDRGNLVRTDTSTSLRLKPSTETIRPRKDKKRMARKVPSINAGNGGSILARFRRHSFSYCRPFLESTLSFPQSSGQSVQSNTLEQEKYLAALLPGNCVDKPEQPTRAGSRPERPPGPLRSLSSSMLIPFRGRSASTKADIFEQKIATAVDQANSSDSEETYVYESNPPEPLSARSHRFHSRTPSATSTISQYDSHGMRTRPDGYHSVVPKKSMKFANNYGSVGHADDGNGTIRGTSQRNTGNNASHHHHHIGRYGRGGHMSILDNNSPFSNATNQTQLIHNNLNRTSPRHSSPRSQHVVHGTKSPQKAEEVMTYDLEGETADDEGLPLLGPNRTARNRRRPLPGSVRQIYAKGKYRRSCWSVTSWTTLFVLLLLAIILIVAGIILCSKPLIDVHVKDIRNVLASEQELMLDLHVRAINPNLVPIQITDLDVLIYARSKHVGTNEIWRSHQPHNEGPASRPRPGKVRINSRDSPSIIDNPSDIVSQFDGIDEGTDPIDDPATDSQTMLLGEITEFDSPLVFESSTFRRRSLSSIGEVRLAKPGNKTEAGGSQRWEHVMQYDFELIARGYLKYSLPVSSSMNRAKIEGKVMVHPHEDAGGSGNSTIA